MESNKKCKVQEKAYSEQRQTNYKNLRKEKEEGKKAYRKKLSEMNPELLHVVQQLI